MTLMEAAPTSLDMDCQTTSAPSTTAAQDRLSLSTKSLPTLPSSSASPTLSVKAAINRPSSILIIPFSTKSNIKRDPTLSDKPNNLPFASTAFAELHRRHASTARTAAKPASPTPPIPLRKAATRPVSPAPPPLPPKPETLHFPDGSRVRASSISAPSAAMISLSGSGTGAITAASWLPSSTPSVPSKRSYKRVSILTKSLKSKMLKRMTTISTLSTKPSPNQQQRKSKSTFSSRRLAHVVPGKRSGTGFPFIDPSSSDEAARLSDSDHGDHDCTFHPIINGAADVENASEAVVRYAEKATFRRPVVVQCQTGSRKVAMREVLNAGPPPSVEPDLRLELDREGDVLAEERQDDADAAADADVESEGYDAEAEERLERRLAEYRAWEQKADQIGAVVVETKAEEPWSDVVYDESILDEHLKRRREVKDDVDEEGGERRPGSAMSELDGLVRDSLFIARDDDEDDDVAVSLDRPLSEAGRGRKRKVSFARPPDVDVTLARKKVAWVGLGTPYPFRDGGKWVDEPYGSEYTMEAAPEQWDTSEFGGRGWLAEGDKARKVLGLIEADGMIGLD